MRQYYSSLTVPSLAENQLSLLRTKMPQLWFLSATVLADCLVGWGICKPHNPLQDCSEAELESLSQLVSILEKKTRIRQVHMLKHAVAVKYKDQESAVQALHSYFDCPASQPLPVSLPPFQNTEWKETLRINEFLTGSIDQPRSPDSSPL